MPLEPFSGVLQQMRFALLNESTTLDRGEWQSLNNRPQVRVTEIHNSNFSVPVPESREGWAEMIDPNLPWAEDHFQERVGGKPLNPGEQYKNWPWYEQGVEEHKEVGTFSHTYMERFWPAVDDSDIPRWGIRFEYGDLNDLVQLLRDRPMTRQAYLPIWFPEDLAAAERGQRVPCTLGYHFQVITGNRVSMTYFMRSCDFFRYLADDVFMAGRLLQWVVDKMNDQYLDAEPYIPSTLHMHIANLHVFADEQGRLEREYKTEMNRRLSSAF